MARLPVRSGFTLLCRRLELFGGEFVAIDGSKFKAQNNKRRNFTREKPDKTIKEIDAKTKGYLDEFDEADEREAEVKTPAAGQLKEKIERLRNRRDKYEQIGERLKESGESQVSLTGPGPGAMKVGQGSDVCYNVSRSECRTCEVKQQCARNKRVRRISRWVDERVLEGMDQRVRANPQQMKKREEQAGHPFGTMKRGMNSGYFLMRGIKEVGAEMSLTILGYNIKRVTNNLGVQKMIGAVG
jgi:Transposase DDE domain